eukprot:scaffold5828_cov168-Amphora_coffeaeformis.AAC.4
MVVDSVILVGRNDGLRFLGEFYFDIGVVCRLCWIFVVIVLVVIVIGMLQGKICRGGKHLPFQGRLTGDIGNIQHGSQQTGQ